MYNCKQEAEGGGFKADFCNADNMRKCRKNRKTEMKPTGLSLSEGKNIAKPSAMEDGKNVIRWERFGSDNV